YYSGTERGGVQRTRSRNRREWSDFTEDTNVAVRFRSRRARCTAPTRRCRSVPASEAGGSQTMHFVCKPAPAHRQSESQDCDWLQSRASSIRASRRGKALHLCTIQLRPRLPVFPKRRGESVAKDSCSRSRR